MKPLLAGKFFEEKVAKQLPIYGQIKYDGIRIFENHSGIASTRSLKAARSEQLQSFFAHNKDMLRGLDGEIICGDPHASGCYSRTDSAVMSFNKPHEDMRFYVFDKWDEPGTFEERMEVFEEICGNFWIDNKVGQVKVLPAETTLFHTMEEVWEFYEEQTLLGHEGIILRRPDSYYKFGRGSPVQCECIKMKEGGWIDTEVLITGFYEENENTNEAKTNALGNTQRSGHKENLLGKGTLGGFEISGKLWDGRDFDGRVGGGEGLTQNSRQGYWDHRDELVGKIAKIKYFKIGVKDKPRFPQFLGIRDHLDMDEEQLDMFK
jgi:DNA ligase-1